MITVFRMDKSQSVSQSVSGDDDHGGGGARLSFAFILRLILPYVLSLQLIGRRLNPKQPQVAMRPQSTR